MESQVIAIAQPFRPSVPSTQNEPALWKWYQVFVFPISVNNVMAQRQFNISELHVDRNESELSKQASHLFIENVLHCTASRLQLYKSQAATKCHQRSVRSRKLSMAHIARQMKDYSTTITTSRLKASKAQLKLLRSGTSQARSRTAQEVYSPSL